MTNESETENASCALCHSTEQEKAYSSFTPPYNVVRCRSCGFHYLSPRLTEQAILKIYKDDAYFESEEDGYLSYKEQEKALHATFKRFMENLRKQGVAGGDLLEVGCGYGYLLEEAKDFFGKRSGIDFSGRACEEARKKADQVYHGGIDQISPADRFDCIVAINVIEHVYHPKPFLEKLRRYLKPGGRIVVATPNMGSFWRIFMGHRWPSFKIPEHILYFDNKSLLALMKQAGLIDIKLMPFPHAFPLTLIAEKMNINLPLRLSTIKLWLPKTMIAMYGTSSD